MDTQKYELGHKYKLAGFAAAVAGVIALFVGAGLYHHGAALQDEARSGAVEHGSLDVTIRHADGRVEKVQSGPNMLFVEGQTLIEKCVHQGLTCPTAFTIRLLSAGAGVCSGSPAAPASGAAYLNTNTWTGTGNLSQYELVVGTSAGYAAQALTRDATGFPTLTNVATGTNGCAAVGAGTCAQISTAQKTLIASSNWTVAGRFVVVTATVGGGEQLEALACLSTDRLLQSGDQLNLTYKQAMQ